jgi:hypothetical protein
MHWRGKIQHIRRCFRREKACRATLIGVTVLFCRTTGSGETRLNFQKFITLRYDVEWRWFLYENYRSRRDLQLFSFEFFRLPMIRCSKKLYNVLGLKWSRISVCRIRKIIYFYINLNGNTFYIKVVAINKINNFVVLNFYI